jgi:hypothetical protein
MRDQRRIMVIRAAVAGFLLLAAAISDAVAEPGRDAAEPRAAAAPLNHIRDLGPVLDVIGIGALGGIGFAIGSAGIALWRRRMAANVAPRPPVLVDVPREAISLPPRRPRPHAVTQRRRPVFIDLTPPTSRPYL